MQRCPLVNLSARPKCEVQEIPSGWFVPAAKGLSVDIADSAEAVIGRVAAGSDVDVVQLGIGAATSRLCNAVFLPHRDEALVFQADGLKVSKGDGSVRVECTGPLRVTLMRDYMKVHRNIPWYQPMDRRTFPKPPAGWCSWYYYYKLITEEEIVRNTDWLAEHLQPFGCQWVQIDDGWQGRGKGHGTNRDWFVTCKRNFPRGMKFIADYIRSKGLLAGIWCIPFTQSDTALYKRQPDLFVHRPDGGSPGERDTPLDYDWMQPVSERMFEWCGRYLIDPTGRAGERYLRKLFEMLCDKWGYQYVKIDAQSAFPGLYAEHRPRLADSSLDGEQAYRKGLDIIKDVMGPERFLLNCGSAWASAGQCEGIRIGGDVTATWSGVTTAAECTLRWLWLNTLAFYTDPDAVCVRDPLSYEQARTWAVLVGITGQLMMTSDKMYELPEDRVELLRRILPVADIHPMELYPLDTKVWPGIFDLKVNLPGIGRWDVVACFNWSTTETRKVELSPQRLGLEDGEYLWQDVWAGAIQQPKDGKLTLEVPPCSCRVLSVWPRSDHPQFIGTNRHLTQGAVDVEAVEWDAKALKLRGRSNVVGGDAYRIRMHVPKGYRAVGNGVEQYGEMAVLTLRNKRSKTVQWEAAFERSAGNARTRQQ
ncbi:MAG: alpha-galactosidase [Phycisphaerae bacterium]|jgi:hypothetical protein